MKRIYRYVFILWVLSTILMSCTNDHENTCDIADPIEELMWLKEQIDQVKEFEDQLATETIYYSIAKYQGETVFFNTNCDPLVNYASVVYNCNGDQIAYTNDIFDDLSQVSRIWESKPSKCND